MKQFSFLVPRTMMRRKQDTSENEYARQRNQVHCIIETNSSSYLKYLIYIYIHRKNILILQTYHYNVF